MELERVNLFSILDLRRRDVLFIYLLTLSALFIFSFLSWSFFSGDFFHLRTISYIEKARLAFQGFPPRLENVGFVYPPLPVLLSILLPFPWLVQGVVGALIYMVMLYFGVKFYRSSYLLFALLPLFLPFLYLALFRFDVLLLFFLISASTLLLLKYWEEGFSLYLFSAGFLFGIAFFIDFSAVFMAVFYSVVILLKRGASISHRVGVALVFLVPSIFFFFFTLFVNFIFKDDPLYFLREYASFFFQDIRVLQAKADFFTAVALFIDYLQRSFPLLLPYVGGLLLVKRWRSYYLSPIFLIYLSPIFLSLLQIRYGFFTFSFSNSVIFTLFLLMFSNRLRLSPVIYILFLISALLSPFVFLKSDDRNEVNFARAFLGREFERNLTFYKEVAAQVNSLNGKVLMDDRSLYPSVLFISDLSKLILPYQYDFYPILLAPCGKVDYVVGVAASGDAVYKMYPQITDFKLDGCRFYGRVGNAFIFSCSKCS